MSATFNTGTHYQNILEDCVFETENPNISPLCTIGATDVKKVSLKAGASLKCHATEAHVLVLWLRGKAKFTANDEEYVMHPGSLLEMETKTPHGVIAETDCVFTLFKFKSL